MRQQHPLASELFGGFEVRSGSALSREQAPEEDAQVCHQVSSSDGCSSTFGVAKQQGTPPPPHPSVLVMTSYLQDAPGDGRGFSPKKPLLSSCSSTLSSTVHAPSCPAWSLSPVKASDSFSELTPNYFSSPKNSLIRVNRQKAERHSLKSFSFPIAKE